MGCLFGCFRFKDDDRQKTHLVSKSISSRTTDPLVSKHQLASVFLCEEKGPPCEQVAHLSLQANFDRDSAAGDEELKQEATFLKSCGALLETPAEIRKASEKRADQFPNDDGMPSKSHSWLPDTSCKELHWDDQQPDQTSDTPTQVHQNSGLPENKSGGSHSEKDRALRKTVQFHEAVVEQSITLDDSPSQADNQIPPLGCSDSPYPTPLSLSEEMQTPGTVYSVKLDNHRTGNNPRIRTQYVYPILNPVENLSQWKALRGESPCQLVQSGIHLEQQLETSSQNVSQKISLTPLSNNSPQDGKRSQKQETISRAEVDLCPETPQLVVSSLSQWLNPPATKGEKLNTNDISKERSHSGKSPDADRPIIGIVAAHWNDDEPSRVSPKWFDGNGIPNSTNKYKEDQKVSWHATPFEERLEKALSDEKLFPQRKLINGRLIELEDEGEESDTAAS